MNQVSQILEEKGHDVLQIEAEASVHEAVKQMVAANVADMNRAFVTELQEPIHFSIGIHGGEVIIGDIGFRDHTVFTALGDVFRT